MPRSYLYIKKNDYDIYFNNDIYQADAIIIDIYDASYIFSNFEKFEDRFKEIKEQGIEIYLKLDSKDISSCYKALCNTKGEFITGWAIPHVSLRLLNRLIMKARDYEQKKKLSFGSLNFIAIIDTLEGILNYRKIAAYERVVALMIDEKSYTSYIGLSYYHDNSYVRNQVALYAAISKKPLIDSSVDDDVLTKDLEAGKRLGAFSKATNDINQLKTINEFYTPSDEELTEAKKIVNRYIISTKKGRKNFKIDSQDISQHKVIRSQDIIHRAKKLGLDSEELELKLIVKGEKLRDRPNIVSTKKFYTIGEEIGNSVTHGVGIIFSLVYLILLLFKGIESNDNLRIIAYMFYGLSAFILYFSSTLYHGLPLGGRSKKLFQKFDHMTIYLLIAGSYTPFTLIGLGGSLGFNLFLVLWAAAISGLLLNLFWFGKFRLFHMFLYVAMGWVAVFYLKPITLSIGTMGTVFLFSGGVAYTLGIIFYSLKLFKFTHMVWHLFVLTGTLLHFIAIFLYV